MSEQTPPQNTLKWWDMKGKQYAKKGDFRDRPDEYKIAAEECVGSVLEIGVAYGEFSKYLPKTVQYIGIEISPHMCGAARKRYPERAFVRADVMHSKDYWVDVCDTVVVMQLLEHFTSTKVVEALAFFASLPQKRLILTVPRGKPSESVVRSDGHYSWWGDGKQFAEWVLRVLQPRGWEDVTVKSWKGAANHICLTVIPTPAEAATP